MIGDQVRGSDLVTWNTQRKPETRSRKISGNTTLFISINFLELGAVIYALGIDPKYVDVCLNLTKIYYEEENRNQKKMKNTV